MSLEAGDGFIPRSDPRIDRPRPQVGGTENLSWKQISEKYPCRNGQVPMHIAAMTGRMNMYENYVLLMMVEIPQMTMVELHSTWLPSRGT